MGLSSLTASGAHLSLMLLWLPVIAVVQYVLILGLVVPASSAFTVFYRDVGIVIGHLMRLLFFMSPDPLVVRRGHRAGRRAPSRPSATTGYALLQLQPGRDPAHGVPARDLRHGRGDCPTARSRGARRWRPTSAHAAGAARDRGCVLLVLGTWFFKRLEPAFAKVL